MAKAAVKEATDAGRRVTGWREWVDEPGALDSPVLTLRDPGPLPKVEIKNKKDTDLALKALGDTDRMLAVINEMMEEAVNKAKAEAVEEAANPLKWKKALEKALEKWAREEDRKGWGMGRTLTLNFGKLYFRLSPPAIRLIRKVEYVLERLRAKRMTSCMSSMRT